VVLLITTPMQHAVLERKEKDRKKRRADHRRGEEPRRDGKGCATLGLWESGALGAGIKVHSMYCAVMSCTKQHYEESFPSLVCSI